jgi:hypothetical protein
MPTRYITLTPSTPATITYTPGFDEFSVYHDNSVAGIVYVDSSGNDAVIPADTTGATTYRVKMVTSGAQRKFKVARFRQGNQATLSLVSATAVRVEVEFP